MWNWIMDPAKVNTFLNLIGILLGGGALAAVLSHWRGLKAMDAADIADVRRHWAEEVAALRRRDDERDETIRGLEKHWREMINLADQRYTECQAERDELRSELAAVKRELEGVKAQIRASSTDRVLLMEENCGKPSEEAPHSLAAAKRLKENGNNRK
jgi:septal ring factor EnvC (AmiA/AmiB activator)